MPAVIEAHPEVATYLKDRPALGRLVESTLDELRRKGDLPDPELELLHDPEDGVVRIYLMFPTPTAKPREFIDRLADFRFKWSGRGTETGRYVSFGARWV